MTYSLYDETNYPIYKLVLKENEGNKYSIDGEVYSISAWSEDKEVIEEDILYFADILIKYDGCSHFYFNGEDYFLDSPINPYYHICGEYGFKKFIIGILFCLNVAKLEIKNFDESENKYSCFNELFKPYTIKRRFPMKIFSIQNGNLLDVNKNKININPNTEYIITKDFLKNNTECIFVFGDNCDRIGCGGAAILRKEPNVYGFITKKSPTHLDKDYYRPSEYLNIYNHEINKLKNLVGSNSKLIFIISKLGAGLANKYKIWEEIILPNIKQDLKEFNNIIFLF